jgi:hypothetical protein
LRQWVQVHPFIQTNQHFARHGYTAEEKGYDAGKKVSGIKRHIAVDTQGLPHAMGALAL